VAFVSEAYGDPVFVKTPESTEVAILSKSDFSLMWFAAGLPTKWKEHYSAKKEIDGPSAASESLVGANPRTRETMPMKTKAKPMTLCNRTLQPGRDTVCV
jgi:hypothetical protein